MNELLPQMMQMIGAKLVTKPLYLAAKLGVADLLAEGPCHVDDLATRTETHPPSLYRVLRALASVGVFAEGPERHFANTPMSQMILSGPGSMRAMVLWLNDPRHDQVWEHALHSVKTGETGLADMGVQEIWPWLTSQRDLHEIFNNAMSSNASNLHAAAATAYDFSGIEHLMDVGGGHGALMMRILAENPKLRGTVYDLPEVVVGARAELETNHFAGRCAAVGGSFFESVPAADAHIMSFILHDWSDEKAITILRNIHKAQPAHGKVLLVEMVVPPGNEPSFAKLLDMEMLIMAGGRERTEAEFAAIFDAAGYRLSRIVPTPSPTSIIEAVKVG